MTTVTTLLAQGRQFDPRFRGKLANHLPMALIALDRLGASDDQLNAFYREYTPRLNPIEAVEPQFWPDWTSAIGQSDAFARLLAHFEVALEREGRDAVLRDALPHLLPGICASAFHALIRLGYGVRQDDSAEIAHALAYWAAEWQDLGPIQRSSRADMAELLTERSAPFEGHRFNPGIIGDRMREVSRHPDFVLGAQQPRTIDWRSLIQLARRAYRDNGHFTVLHGLTSLHALWMLRPWLKKEEEALRYFWLAYLVAFITTGKPVPGPEPESDPAVTPSDARAWAVGRDDDHDIKLVYTCLDFHEQADATEQSQWLAAIERRMADQ